MTTTLNAATAGVGGFIASSDNSGVLALQTSGTTAITVDASQRVAFVAGTAALPAITTTGDTNTGIFFPAADTIAFSEGGAESMRIDSSGNVGIGTSSPRAKLSVTNGTENTSGDAPQETIITGANQTITSGLGILNVQSNTGIGADVGATIALGGRIRNTGLTTDASNFAVLKGAKENATSDNSAGYFAISTKPNALAPVERMRIDSSGNFMVGTTSADPISANVAGISMEGPVGSGKFSRSSNAALDVNRKTNDGELVRFYQDGTQEGNISVSGTTVSYNGGHLARYAQTTTVKDESLVKGTVLSNIDAMNVYTDAEGNPVANEQLNKVKVSDVEGDANVAGVFVNWSYDEQHSVDEINMAMTGDMIIRIAQGVTVQRGDLLMSAGDGTAKPQDDDIVRSKTIAKVTSNHVTCTYADGSYCVPCVLMAC